MRSFIRRLFSRRTRSGLRIDLYRLRARSKSQWTSKRMPSSNRLHFGCGGRRIQGWLNVDLMGSDVDIDLGSPLPWRDQVFDAIVSQQVVEHLEIESEFIPLLKELARVSRPRAEIWLSCPDMEKVCRAYVADGGKQLLEDRQTRHDCRWIDGMPVSHVINVMFHQGNEHKNLYDFPLMKWLLERHGFTHVERVNEPMFLARFPEFPPRNDDFHALYVRAFRE